jgi:hypothetical protein
MPTPAKAKRLSLDDFIEWSRPATKFNLQACKFTWRSFKAGRGIGEGTLYRLAAAHGWSDKGETRPVPMPTKTAPAPAIDPAVIWDRCEAARPGHGYIESKAATGAPLGGLRVVPAGDPLRIMGESMAGALVVPELQNMVQRLQSLRFARFASFASYGRPARCPEFLKLLNTVDASPAYLEHPAIELGFLLGA